MKTAQDVHKTNADTDLSDFKKEHGISDWCPLSLLHLFDIIRDIMPDLMHIIMGLVKRHLLKLLKGERTPKAPKYLSTTAGTRKRMHGEGEIARRKEANKRMKAEYTRSVKV
jgi:hypothetical protein